MAAEDAVNDSIRQLLAAHDALHDYASANAAKYDPAMNLLVTANLSDMLTRIGDLDASVIVQQGNATLQECNELGSETQKFATAAKNLQQTQDGLAKSISFVTAGLQMAMYLAKSDVPSAGKLLYNTLNP